MRSSLIVLTYNGWELLEPCLKSLFNAASDEDEVIVVDNGSTDETATKVASHFPQAVLVDLPKNTYIFGLNEGLKVASGKYIAFLNNDMTVHPRFVEDALAEFTASDIFAVCPRILEQSGAEQGSRTSGYWSRGLLFYTPLPHVDDSTDCFFAVGGQSFFDKEKLLEIGSIDPLLWPMYHEDVELSYRAWKRGWRIRYAPRSEAYHLGGTTSRKVFTPLQLRSFVRQNEFLIVWKDITDKALLAQHVLFLIPRLAAATVKRDWATLVGFVAALRRLPQALAARRSARQHFTLSDKEVLARVAIPA